MSIRREHGGGEALVDLAGLAGEAEGRRAGEERAFDFAMKLQQQKDRMEMAAYEADVRKQAKAQNIAWEYEKINIAHQNEFAMRENIRMMDMEKEATDRARKKQELDAVLKQIDETDTLTDHEKTRFKMNAMSKSTIGAGAPQFDMPSPMDIERHRMAQERDIRSGRADVRAEEAGLRAERSLALREEISPMDIERHQMALRRDLRAGRSEVRSETALARRQEPSFAEKRAALGVLEDVPEPTWLQRKLPGGVGPLTTEEELMRATAKDILNFSAISNTPEPRDVTEFEGTVQQLGLVDPVKARQYYDQYADRF